jgi:hypothetical protein
MASPEATTAAAAAAAGDTAKCYIFLFQLDLPATSPPWATSATQQLLEMPAVQYQ